MGLPEHVGKDTTKQRGSLEDGEDWPDGDEAVNVGAAVQGVEGDDVLSLALCLHLDLVLILL